MHLAVVTGKHGQAGKALQFVLIERGVGGKLGTVEHFQLVVAVKFQQASVFLVKPDSIFPGRTVENAHVIVGHIAGLKIIGIHLVVLLHAPRIDFAGNGKKFCPYLRIIANGSHIVLAGIDDKHVAVAVDIGIIERVHPVQSVVGPDGQRTVDLISGRTDGCRNSIDFPTIDTRKQIPHHRILFFAIAIGEIVCHDQRHIGSHLVFCVTHDQTAPERTHHRHIEHLFLDDVRGIVPHFIHQFVGIVLRTDIDHVFQGHGGIDDFRNNGIAFQGTFEREICVRHAFFVSNRLYLQGVECENFIGGRFITQIDDNRVHQFIVQGRVVLETGSQKQASQ